MRLASGLTLLGLAILFSGCGGNDPAKKNEVTGKVTLDGKSVSGNVVFVGVTDKKESPPALIKSDGTYSIDLPPGEYLVAVRSLLASSAMGAPPVGSGAPPAGGTPENAGTSAPTAGAAGGVAAPAKYANAEESGLRFKHDPGKQEYNIELKP